MHMRPSISTETIPLPSVSDCEVWNVIRFFHACGETAAEIHRQISAVYGKERCMSKSIVCRYFTDRQDRENQSSG